MVRDLAVARAVAPRVAALRAGGEAAERAFRELERMGAPAVPAIIGAFASEAGPRADPKQVTPIMLCLRNLGSPAVVPALIEALDDDAPGVPHYAGMTLAYIGERAVPALIDTVAGDGDADRRAAAAWILSMMGDVGDPAIPALTAALDDPAKEVRYTARYALHQLELEGDFLSRAAARARAKAPKPGAPR